MAASASRRASSRTKSRYSRDTAVPSHRTTPDLSHASTPPCYPAGAYPFRPYRGTGSAGGPAAAHVVVQLDDHPGGVSRPAPGGLGLGVDPVELVGHGAGVLADPRQVVLADPA